MKPEHQILFSPMKIGNMEVKNRYAMSAMEPFGMTDNEGIPTDECVEYYVTRAKGGIGLIITGMCIVEDSYELNSPSGFLLTSKTNKLKAMKQWSRMAERIHAYGGKLFVQLSAGYGRAAMVPFVARGAVSCSENPNVWNPEMKHRELTKEEIHSYIKAFGEAAAFLKHCSVDGVEIHAVHEGYLIDQFATEYWNKRTDEYGGSFENRYRFALEILQSIKTAAGKDFPVSLRYTPKHMIKGNNDGAIAEETFAEAGRDMPEGIKAAKYLTENGYDALNIDLGCYDAHWWNHPSVYQEDALYLDAAAQIKEVVDVPVIVAGRMDDPDTGAAAIAEGKIDMVSLGRPSLADPELPNKVATDHCDRIRPCISCNYGCSAGVLGRARMTCTVNAEACDETHCSLTPALEKKNIVVIGGGPAGAEAARVSAKRGHNVVLLEKEDRIGGALIVASKASFKKHDTQLADYYATELKENHVDVHLNTEATVEEIKKYNPDEVIVATGATPFVVPIPGVENACIAEDILNDINKAGNNVVIIGAGQVGVETGIWLAKEGRHVEIVEVTPKFMPQGHMSDVHHAEAILKYYKANVHLSTKVKEICSDGVIIEQDGQESKLSADTVIMATGYRANDSLYKEISKEFNCVYNLGDSVRARNIWFAVHDAYELASHL